MASAGACRCIVQRFPEDSFRSASSSRDTKLRRAGRGGGAYLLHAAWASAEGHGSGLDRETGHLERSGATHGAETSHHNSMTAWQTH